MSKIELTAPAGNFEKGSFALHYGADSIYTGYPGFSLRAGAEKFNLDKVQELVKLTHQRNKKIYFALNIFAHNPHVEQFKEALNQIEILKPDGLILSDPGFIELTRNRFPDMHLTLSTQANTTNYASVRFWEKHLNINRVVVARELSVDEIRQIREESDVEIEAFVHGAVCMAYSGRCLLSGMMTSPEWNMSHEKFGSERTRHANLGDCIQPCRFNFALIEENRRDLAFPIEEDKWGTYILSAKDLCLVDYLKELHEAGVDVFKIEGRMKSIYYVANVTRVYREAIEQMQNGKTLSEEVRSELFNVSHRSYSAGFTIPEIKNIKEASQGYIKKYRLHAIVSGQTNSIGLTPLKVFNGFKNHAEIEIIGPKMKEIHLSPGNYQLFDKNQNPIEHIKHQQDGYIKCNAELTTQDILRIKFEK